MKAAIVSIGDELVLGESVDTNTAWLADQLARRSITTVEHRSLGDDQDRIAAALAELVSRVDLIILTGGLGPTNDDLTREALNDVVNPGQPMVTDADAVAWLESRFARQGRTMPPMNLRQAQRAANMRVMPNPHGTAPGLTGRLGRCSIFALPGPPSEMQPMFNEHVAPSLAHDAAGGLMLTGQVHAYGIGESDAAQRLGYLTDRHRHPLIGITVSGSIVTARIRAEGPEDLAREQIEADMQQIETAWWPYAFGRDDTSQAASVGELLRDSGGTLVTAESCTGGLLGKMLVDVPKSSSHYLGGWITYSNDLKSNFLAVPRETIQAHGAVSRQVAEAMASGAMANADADYALAITGLAGPDGGTVQKPVGTVYIALAHAANDLLNITTRHFIFPGDRSTVRDRTAKAALQMLRFALLEVVDQTPLLWEAPRAATAMAECRQ